jgi:hypothetical protein
MKEMQEESENDLGKEDAAYISCTSQTARPVRGESISAYQRL